MAAPNGTVWGSAVVGSKNTRQGKIGIYVGVTNTDSATSVNVQVWFWTMYSCDDGYNTLYYDAGTSISSATTSIGSTSIGHTVDTGSGWSTSNQTRLLNKTYSYSRGKSDVVYKVYAKYTGIDMLPSKIMYANTTYTVPKLASYTISYNANGGSGAPGSQTKYYGQALTLSTTKPTRTGYTFKGWSTSSTATSATWTAGSSYTTNAAATLYAVWQAVTYKVTYNANGGSGAPGSQTKTHGQTLVLSTTTPTRTNYNFKGWATSSTATTATYSAGGNYTTNAAATLYAVWELAYTAPRITNLKVYRVDSVSKQPSDSGTIAKISFEWTVDKPRADVGTFYKKSSDSEWTFEESGYASQDATATTGTWEGIVGTAGYEEMSVDVTHDIKIIVSDAAGSSEVLYTLATAGYVIDFLSGGNGVSFGKAAEKTNAAEFDFDIYANKNIYDKYGMLIGNGLTKYTGSGSSAIDANTTSEHCILTDKNTPTSSFWYVITYFYSDKSGNNRSQVAIPYASTGAMFHRYYYNGAWSSWGNTALDSYPINSIYISYSHTSPASMFGGTWVRIQNAFLWGSTSSGTIGTTGGEQTHTLVINEIPSHNHGAYNYNGAGYTLSNFPFAWGSEKKGYSGNLYTEYTGGGAAHNNMPPYIHVSIWRRTA